MDEPPRDTRPTQEQAVLDRMERLLSGRLPLVEAETVLARDVVKHMDEYSSVGIDGWRRWFYFLQEKGRIADLSVRRDRQETNLDGTITLYGQWEGTSGGEPVAAENLSVTYRVQGDRIVELWTTRANYVFFFGGLIRYRIGLWMVYVYMLLWYYLSGRESLADRLADERRNAAAEGA